MQIRKKKPNIFQRYFLAYHKDQNKPSYLKQDANYNHVKIYLILKSSFKLLYMEMQFLIKLTQSK